MNHRMNPGSQFLILRNRSSTKSEQICIWTGVKFPQIRLKNMTQIRLMTELPQDLRGEVVRGAGRPRHRPGAHALPREARRVGRPARRGRGPVAG